MQGLTVSGVIIIHKQLFVKSGVSLGENRG